jgi:hypothetical protein
VSTGPVLALLLGASGALGGLLAIRRGLDGRRWSALGHAVAGMLLAGVALWSWPLVQHLEQYAILWPSRPVADLVFARAGPDRYRATLTHLPGGRMQVLELSGNEWRLDARVLGWHPWATALGLRQRYRIERLASRHRGKVLAESRPGARHELAPSAAGDPWQLAREQRRWHRLIDARAVVGSYVPMADGARFRVSLGTDGLRVTPVNAAAERSLGPDGRIGG